MGGFLRLQVYGPALSDEEFIAAVREAAKARRVFRPGRVLGNYILLLGVLLAVMLPLWLVQGLSGQLPGWLDLRAAAALASLLGVFPGMLIAYGRKLAADARRDQYEDRLARLLLECRDDAGEVKSSSASIE